MASLFRYNLCLISCGAPAGLAVYHYFIKENGESSKEVKKCCCNEREETGCTGECEETCKKKEK